MHGPYHGHGGAIESVVKASDAQLMRLATYCSMAVGLSLIGAKFYAWFSTDSLALLSTLIDSTLDAAASALNLLAIRHALTPADDDHRFGHGKAEPLAGLAQSTFIAGSSLFLLSEAVHRLFDPQPVANGDVGIGVMVLSIVLTVALVLFQRYVVKRTQSLAINADKLHYTADLLMNISVIVSLVVAARFNWPYADPLFAIGISGFLLWGAASIGRQSYQSLMDRELPVEDRRRILGICTSTPDVVAAHDLRTRSSGIAVFIQVHLEFDGNLTLNHVHRVADQVEARIQAEYPKADVIIHQDPRRDRQG